MRLWSIILMAICNVVVHHGRNPVFSTLIRDHSKSHAYYDDSSSSIEGDTYEIVSVEGDRRYNISMDEHYADAMQEAFEIFGEHREMIEMLEKQLNQASKESGTGRWKHLQQSLHATENLIEQKTEVLREKFGSEMSYKEMTTDPIEKSTLETLLNFWREVKRNLNELKSEKKVEGVEELGKWLENVDRKTRTQYDIIVSIITKIKTMKPNDDHHGEEKNVDSE